MVTGNEALKREVSDFTRISFIYPQRNCYVIVYDGKNFGGKNKEAYVRREDADFLIKKRHSELGEASGHKLTEYPDGHGYNTCSNFWGDNTEEKWKNWICGWWEDRIKSYTCECVLDDERNEFEDRLEETDEDEDG